MLFYFKHFGFALSSYNVEALRISDKQILLKAFNNTKDTLIWTHKKHVEELDRFDKKFNDLVKEYFKESDTGIKNIQSSNLIKNNNMEIDSVTTCPDLRASLMKVFFEDLMSFCFEFFFKTKSVFYSNPDFRRYMGCKTGVRLLLKRIPFDTKFCKKNNMDFNYISMLKTPYHNFMFFVSRLEEIISKRTGYSVDEIRKCLYYNDVFELETDDQLVEFYKNITHYFYSSSMGIVFPIEQSQQQDTEPKTDHYRPNFQNTLKAFIIPYKSCFKLSINTRDLVLHTPENYPAYTNFIENLKILMSCCLSENTNILNLHCTKHTKTIRQTIKYYFKPMKHSPFAEKSYFEKAVDAIEIFFRHIKNAARFSKMRISQSP
ncbi:hypothetical protein CDIK_0455 [Cucumispora dikerogammari]|nr:hypothetical protein CDIK_0455 [Cucumispora dikerogammari]